MSHALTFMGLSLVARASGALWWPDARLLCVSDLHLGRSERIARRGGGLLPPYETADTLERLRGEIDRLQPAQVLCLGDSFDDQTGRAALRDDERQRLDALVAEHEWVWIAGNHDPWTTASEPQGVVELAFGPLRFRHEPQALPNPGEVAGHLHPKLSRRLGGRLVSRSCFLLDARRMILPAFGTYTGGLSADDPALFKLFEPHSARAILTGTPCVALPLAAASRRSA